MSNKQIVKENLLSLNELGVNYKIAGIGPVILILHGWGSSSDSWTKVQELLAGKRFSVIVPDLPGFGKTEVPSWPKASEGQSPKEVWGVEEYADFVYQFAKVLNIEKFSLAGHSFGGQIAIQFAVKYPEKLEKLILIASAAIRRKSSFARIILKCFAKALSFFLYLVPWEDLRANIRNSLYMLIRRRDYVKARGIMKEVFQKVIQQDLTPLFPKIQPPTLLIWGAKDELTPVGHAYIMKNSIPRASLEIISGAKHALNFEASDKISEMIARFLQDKN